MLTLYDRMKEQSNLAGTERRQKMQADRHRAGTLTKQRDRLSVAAECLNVLLNPVQSHQLIIQPCIAWSFRVTTQTEETQCAHAIADLSYNHHSHYDI